MEEEQMKKQDIHWKKKKKIFAHPVSVTTGEVDLSQSVPINELTQERCMCGLGEEIHFSTQFCERHKAARFQTYYF